MPNIINPLIAIASGDYISKLNGLVSIAIISFDKYAKKKKTTFFGSLFLYLFINAH